ncbi:MAG: ankyrin repeat domain-containing protein [Gammaproteobacteria bacterium]
MKERWRKSAVLVAITATLVVLGGCAGDADKFESGKPIDLMTPAELFSDPGLRSLASAAQHGDTRKIDTLIAKGVNVNGTGRFGETPLFSAFQVRNKRGFKALLEHGANPNFIDDDGQTLLNDIAGYSSKDFMGLALKYGGDPNLVAPRSGETPLFFAVRPDGKQNIALLIKAGADLNHQDDEGETALMAAAMLNQYDAVYELLEAGANFRLQDKWGKDIRFSVGLSEKTMAKSGHLWKSLQRVVDFLKAHDFWPPPKSQQYH